MFVIEKLFVEDKNLPKVLYAVTGLVYKMEPPRPVVNVVAKNGKLKQASSAATIKAQMLEWASHLKGKDVTSNDLKEQAVKFGGSPASGHYIANVLTTEKILKRKERGIFHVL